MKKLIYFFVLLLASLFFVKACSKDDDANIQGRLLSNSGPSLSEEEGLLFMREEEKLARDVYTFFYKKYGHQVFGNISGSEQQHMDAVLNLIESYGLVDPASSEYGVFNNQNLQTLYDQLISRGSGSLLEAMKVGALIEELDIRDLQHLNDETTSDDIIQTYNFLECGSRNHLRAFNRQVNRLGGTYTAVYISQETYDDIAFSEKEKCYFP